MKLETLAIDFDGVIHDHKHPVEGKVMGPPMEGAKMALRGLTQKYKVVIFSVWGGDPKAILDWLRFYDMPIVEVTDKKPHAKFYIDDKAIHFDSWQNVLKLL